MNDKREKPSEDAAVSPAEDLWLEAKRAHDGPPRELEALISGLSSADGAR